jgi:signal transduction histidine kinase
MKAKFIYSFLKSKISRRIFLLFISCAIFPIATLSYISFETIYNELNYRAQKDLRQQCKDRGLDILNNLLLLESKIKLISALISNDKIDYLKNTPPDSIYCFNNLMLINGSTIKPIIGNAAILPELTDEEINNINDGKIIISVKDSKILMIKKMADGMIAAEIKKEFLWMNEPQFYVLSADYTALTESHLPFNVDKITDIHSNYFHYADGGEQYIASYRPMYLKSNFSSPDWLIVMARSQLDVLQPLYTFRRNFILLCLLSFSFVLLLSLILIRRSLVPIEILKRGTRNVAGGDFKSLVTIRSGDEFEELGESFNKMSKDLEEMQSMLIQTEKMKTIGQMSSAIVHEIKQPLTAVKGYLELLCRDEDLSEKNQKYLGIIQKTTDRIAKIADKFNRLARTPGDETFSEVFLNDSLMMVYEVLEHQITQKKITLSLNLDNALPPIVGDDNNLQQIFMNLIVNAIDAIEDGHTTMENPNKKLIQVSTHASNGEVIAKVEDNGPGIPKELREKIFEPFFTTKAVGKGTGLGLAVIKSIIKEHKGTIAIESQKGIGTCFILTFPAAEKWYKSGNNYEYVN